MIIPLIFAAVLFGAVLGMRFKVVALVPAIVISSILAFDIGYVHYDHFWLALLITIAIVAALQVGYLCGSVIRFVAAGAGVAKAQVGFPKSQKESGRIGSEAVNQDAARGTSPILH